MVRWKIAVTTAPRHPNFLEQTVVSLQSAGWDYSNITVYAEPSSVSVSPPVVVEQHTTVLGPWRNWLHTLGSLCAEDCEYIAIVQDDLIFRPGLKKYLNETMMDYAVYSPYVSKRDAISIGNVPEGWHPCTSGWHLCGACFFAMPLSLGQQLCQTLPAIVPENKHIDAVVALHLQQAKIPLYVHMPSLVQHLADAHSTMGYGRNPHCRTAHQYTEEPID
ncbi:hypothetical protein KC906_01845 [Candidatus Kaiserbacteria bacterium]|nr:hypothetical protein [Candidatus Kaiserbacteria bacterium]